MKYSKGPAHALEEIDPDTLPEDDVWPEVARRVEAWDEGRDGWRTGDIDSAASPGSDDDRRCRS